MSKSQAQQPPNANPLATNPVGNQPSPGMMAPVTVSGPTAGFLGASPDASGNATIAGGPDTFWPVHDQARTGNAPQGMQPSSSMPTAGATAGGLAMPKPMDTNGRLLPRDQITGMHLPQASGGVTGGTSTNTPYGPTVNSVPTGNVPSLVGGDALGTAMQDAQGAAYKNAAGYLDPQWKNSQDTLESKLANQGVMQNSEAWNKGMGEHARQKEFAYSQARSGAVQQGNAAQAQLFNQGLAANANQFGQNLEGGKFSNAVQQQLAAQGFTQQQIDNLEQQHRFDNSMSMRNQDINELLLQQQNPLNMMNALNSGGQVQQPQFTSTPGSNMNPTDILAAIQAQYGGQLNAYNAQTGSANSANSGMAGIIAALLCDRRLKKNIRKIGVHVVGVPLYEFDYLWGEHAVGVMADELEVVKPEAVRTLRNGFKYVDYARL